ncbi:MAG: quinate 5-dehydrogenase, partial [Actinobacteria bacterium]|nr:quinate 5-dehydrogenase [Actinomycetota bacterium]
MKQVTSVSIGSSKRDHVVEMELLGQPFRIAREGYDGDIAAAANRFRELDGKVDALGMGGIDIFLRADGRRYNFRESKKLVDCVKKTPLLDGSGLKGPIEGSTVKFLQDEMGLDLEGKKVLIPSTVDRWGIAEAFHDAGCEILAGDLVYAVGIPTWIRSWTSLRMLIRIAAPVI